MNKFIALVSIAVLSCGCTVGPNYKKPAATVPGTYRGLAPEETGKTESGSIGDQKWWEVFQDEQLRSLIRTALQQNYDVRIAAARILQAQAQLGITRADQFPSVSGGADIADQRTAKSAFLPAFERSTGQLNVSAAWELDFWGKFRRATEAARANLFASEWARQEIIATLVANISAAYFQLRALDLELEISKRTLASRQESLRLTSILADHGSTSMLDVRQAEQLVFTAAAEIPALEQQIEQQENFISTLLGKNPDAVPRGEKLTEQKYLPEVPPGLPSSLLERRPDIREAEQQLIAANAQIGVAQAAYFPQISLSGTGGFLSAALTDLFGGPAGTWNFGASLAQPIFTAGRLRSNVRFSEAQKQATLLSYQQAIQTAFRSVSDALIAYRKSREFRAQEELLFNQHRTQRASPTCATTVASRVTSKY
jgi:multidrug efflux system outer membrane protein